MKRYSSVISLCIIALAVYWSFYDMKPSNSNKEIKGSFSINNALSHVKAISKEVHHVGTTAHKKAQKYIVDELEKLNLTVEIQQQAVINNKWFAGTTTENILARIRGSENGKALLLLSHYDSSPHSAPGASDAGSGVAAILEGVRAFLASGKQPLNDIIILISDAEELGLLGAKAFVNHHPWAKEVGLVLNFEARGSGGPSYMLMETNGKNSRLITEFIKANPTYPVANSLMYSIYKKLPNDTDLTVFREEGNINGFNFAFIGDHFDYHTAQDTFERLDSTSLAHQADYLMNTLYHFSDIDLNSLNSDKDHIYVNFPFVKLIHYPFSWINKLLIGAVLLFIIALFLGLLLHRIQLKNITKGFAAFIFSIFLCGGVSWLLWKGLVFIHPQYQDILHGFTYNGYTYIAAFSLLNLWLLFTVYKKYAGMGVLNLLVAPITFWLLINFLILEDFKGAGFLIIPVFIALIIFTISIFSNNKKHPLLFTILSVPTIYMISPMIKMFPVGLGLGILFVSGILICLLFGLLLPVFLPISLKKGITRILFILMLVLFIKASFNTGFSEDRKKPNSLVYVKNADDNTAHWGTYNKTLDAYIKQRLGEDPIKGGISNANTKSKYNTRFNYYTEAENKDIPGSVVTITQDTIVDGSRYIRFRLNPQRKVHKLEFITQTEIQFNTFEVNSAKANNGEAFEVKKGSFLIYHLNNIHQELDIFMSIRKDSVLEIILNEISYDLLTHPLFDLKPRTTEMMPMPFVTNDAVIYTRKLQL